VGKKKMKKKKKFLEGEIKKTKKTKKKRGMEDGQKGGYI
jgi:hypothetical protein